METKIKIGTSPTLKIRGVLADKLIKKGEIFERCPIILVPKNQEEHLDKTVLGKYYFEWTKTDHCFALGYGSLYNHSYSPNAKYEFDYRFKRLIFKALQDIPENEEIFVNYNWKPNSQEKIHPDLLDYDIHNPIKS